MKLDADPEVERARAALEAGWEFWFAAWPEIHALDYPPGTPNLDLLLHAFYQAVWDAGRRRRGG